MSDKPAAIQATFSDFKVIRGRKVAQIICELPLEQADAALATLGGLPQPAAERWVALRAELSRLSNEQQPGWDSIVHELGECPTVSSPAPLPGPQDVRDDDEFSRLDNFPLGYQRNYYRSMYKRAHEAVEYWKQQAALAQQELNDISAAIGSPRFMDPPDGGDVSLAEQVKRMREALETAEAQSDQPVHYAASRDYWRRSRAADRSAPRSDKGGA